jgi:hypothetical protein
MNIDKFVLGFVGFMVLISVLLSQVHSPNWLYLTIFVGFMALQSSITNFCPLAFILKKLGMKPGQAFK